MTKVTAWGRLAFYVRNSTAPAKQITVYGRERWALECLIEAGEMGCTPIKKPGPRWSAYIFDLRSMGIDIETIREAHHGPFEGTHARYVLRSQVTREEGDAP